MFAVVRTHIALIHKAQARIQANLPGHLKEPTVVGERSRMV